MSDRDRTQARGEQFYNRSTATPSNAIEVPQLTLAKGGGALKPIDDTFHVNAVTGTASIGLALPITPARVTPALALRYDSGNGNAAFGLGWTLDVPAISRRTDKRLPCYRDGDDDDTFVMTGADDLVPMLLDDGTPWQSVVGSAHIARYRPRIEGGFALIERVWLDGEPTFYWKVTTGANHVTYFGLTAASRLADPADPARVVRWLPELGHDDKGNVVVYDYKAEDGAGGPSGVHDRNRYDELGQPRFTQRYVKGARYGNREPWYTPSLYAPAIPELTFAFEVVLDYGEHGAAPPDGATEVTIPYAGDRPWPARVDPHSDYRAGFEVRTLRLCRRLLMFHRFAELGVAPELVRSLDLAYAASQPGTTELAEVTYLVAATSCGYARRSGDLYVLTALPAQRFAYQPLSWQSPVHELAIDELVNAPAGLGENYRWVDLWSEGISGILSEQAGALYYKRNLGDGRFTAARAIASQPSFTGLAIADLDADGSRQLVAPGRGFFELADDERWQPFVELAAVPNVDVAAPNVLQLDLDGDGRADLLITEDAVVRWYPSRGRAGYAAAEPAVGARDEERGPRLLWNDRRQRIFLADLAGDGLADIVRVRNGEVCYWPNLGYGKFGDKVTMANAPRFASADDFDPRRVQLADVTGTGANDLLYLDGVRAQVWLNASGNGWSAPHAIELPDSVDPDRLMVVDLLGNGTPCVAWSSPLPRDAFAPLRYIDLFGGHKPHLLIETDNGFGKRTTLGYRSSTKFYLDDARAGTPWQTKLPFPVHCLARVEVREQVTESLLVTQYSYHHGYYDHVEREWRGFGRVDQTDSETFAQWVKLGGSNVVDERFHQPIVLTRTWFHTGAPPDGGDPLALFAADYWYRNPELLALTTPADEPALPPARLPATLAALELREAFRACKGMALRKEVFALDAPAQGATDAQRIAQLTPYSVALHNCHVHLVQRRGDQAHAVFQVIASEALTLAYERRPDDARIAHTLQLEIDRYGNALKSASVVYSRQLAAPPPGLPPIVWDAQRRTHITISERVMTDDDFTAGASPYRVPAEAERRSYELTGVAPSGGLFALDALAAALASATEIGFEVVPPDDDQPRKRLLERGRVLYLADDLASPRAFGNASPLGLPYQAYQLAFTEPVLRTLVSTEQLADAELDPVLLGEGHYVHLDGDGWWIPSGTVDYLDASLAPQRFFQPAGYVDQRGARTDVTYLGEDATRVNATAHWGVLALTRDAIGNQAQIAAYDFRALSPTEVIDLNGNRSGVVFDDLGRVVATAVLGKGGDADSLDELRVRLADHPAQVQHTEQFLSHADDASAAWLLADATSRWVYDHTGVPLRVASITRERHVRDLADTGDPLRLQLAFEYLGGGGPVMKKARVAGARWLTTGRTVLNNKGMVVQQFEPYFADDHAFDPAQLLVETGVSPFLTYDSAGRATRTDYPDGSFAFTRFDAWSHELHDQNDTVLDSAWFSERTALPVDDPQRLAAEQTAMHANTPLVSHLDSLGRAICSVAHHRGHDGDGKPIESSPTLSAKLDIEGNVLAVIDARGNPVMQQRYDLLGRGLYRASMDAGERSTLIDSAGAPLYGWDSRGHRARHVYDPIHRPVQQWLRVASEPEVLVHAQQWGEAAPAAAANNLRGRLWKLYDSSGMVETVSHDLDGNRTESRQRFSTRYDETIAWPVDDPDVLLEAETFRTRARYDALGRPIQLFSPDTSAIPATDVTLGYDAGGRVTRVTARLRGGAPVSFVDDVTYNAKGQRLAIRYGNGVRTDYAYDEKTFRLTRMTTTRGANDILQDVHYVYDPSANLIMQRDDAQQTTYFAGAVAAPSGWYEYDSLYRLTRARGREHIGQNAPANAWDAERSHQILPGDGQALQPYEERYEYDLAGNIEKLLHAASSAGEFENRWTRTYSYQATSNRLESTTTGGTTVAYSYNPHGSMQSMPHLQAMDWDPFERLQHIQQGTTHAYYTYDHSGQRTRKVVEKAAVREVRLYLGGFEIFRRYRNGILILERESQHITDDPRRLAVIETRTIDDGSDDSPAQAIRYQLGNHLDTAMVELDHSGDVISYEEYHPFGSTAWQAGRTAAEVSLKRYRHTGKERDEESGLDYCVARYYASWLGRWTAPDPIGTGDGPNLYAYCQNSPIVLHDPNGTDTWCSDKIPGPGAGSTLIPDPQCSPEPASLFAVAPRPGAKTAEPPPPAKPKPKPAPPKEPPVDMETLKAISERLQPRLRYNKTTTRVFGAGQAALGVLELAGAIYTSETVVGGLVLGAQGLDDTLTGFRQLATGVSEPSFKYRLGSLAVSGITDDPKWQNVGGVALDTFGTAAATGVGLWEAARPITLPPVTLPPRPMPRSLSAAAAGDPQLRIGEYVTVVRGDTQSIRAQVAWQGKQVRHGGKSGTSILVEEYRINGINLDDVRFGQAGDIDAVMEFKWDYSGSIASGNADVAASLQAQAAEQLRLADELGVPLEWHVPQSQLTEFQTVLGPQTSSQIQWRPYSTSLQTVF